MKCEICKKVSLDGEEMQAAVEETQRLIKIFGGEEAEAIIREVEAKLEGRRACSCCLSTLASEIALKRYRNTSTGKFATALRLHEENMVEKTRRELGELLAKYGEGMVRESKIRLEALLRLLWLLKTGGEKTSRVSQDELEVIRKLRVKCKLSIDKLSYIFDRSMETIHRLLKA